MAARGLIETGIALALGFSIAMVGVSLLDVDIDRDFFAAFVLIPVGIVIVVATVWALVSRYLRSGGLD